MRGTSGSGKSWLGRAMFEKYGGEDVFWPAGVAIPGRDPWARRKVVGHVLPGGLFLAGSYDDRGVGLEGLGSAVVATQIPFVERAACRFPFVYAESLLSTQTSPDRFAELRERSGIEVVMALLDTPLEVCLARKVARAGNEKTSWRHKNNYERAWSNQLKFEALGMAAILDHMRPVESLEDLFRVKGWS